jgi:iron-sulfur cluster assembly protein
MTNTNQPVQAAAPVKGIEVTQPRERDRVFQFGDVRIFIDPKSFVYLHGMTLDWTETLMHSGFAFINPNAQKSCGCGTSFS